MKNAQRARAVCGYLSSAWTLSSKGDWCHQSRTPCDQAASDLSLVLTMDGQRVAVVLACIPGAPLIALR